MASDGVRDTTELDTPQTDRRSRARVARSREPDGVAPKAGYPTLDPRHEDKPYRP